MAEEPDLIKLIETEVHKTIPFAEIELLNRNPLDDEVVAIRLQIKFAAVVPMNVSFLNDKLLWPTIAQEIGGALVQAATRTIKDAFPPS